MLRRVNDIDGGESERWKCMGGGYDKWVNHE